MFTKSTGQPLHQIVSGSEPLALAQSSSKPGINDSAESTCTLQAHHGGALIISLAGRFLFRHTVGGKQNLQENEGDQLPDVFCRRTPPLLPLAFRIALIGVVCCCPQIRSSCHLVFGPGFLPSSGCVLRCIPNFQHPMAPNSTLEVPSGNCKGGSLQPEEGPSVRRLVL